MNNNTMLSHWVAAALLVSLLGSCVSVTKFRKVESSWLSSETDLINKRKEIEKLREDTARVGILYRAVVAQNRDIENYSTYSQSALYKQINQLQQQLAQIQNLDSERGEALAKAETELAAAQNALVACDTQLAPLLALITQHNQNVVNLRLFAGQMMIGFESKDITVNPRNGNIHIIIAEGVLFEPAGYRIKAKGQQLLPQLGAALAFNPAFNLVVEGHTDNLPFEEGRRDNWDLSVLRATEVSRLLIKGGMHPARITAAGRGEHAPIADNSTAEGRLQNRRVEIVLQPVGNFVEDILQAGNK